jgi:hypothetical protein
MVKRSQEQKYTLYIWYLSVLRTRFSHAPSVNRSAGAKGYSTLACWHFLVVAFNLDGSVCLDVELMHVDGIFLYQQWMCHLRKVEQPLWNCVIMHYSCVWSCVLFISCFVLRNHFPALHEHHHRICSLSFDVGRVHACTHTHFSLFVAIPEHCYGGWIEKSFARWCTFWRIKPRVGPVCNNSAIWISTCLF